jgi:superfamily II DNA/RNA helicase
MMIVSLVGVTAFCGQGYHRLQPSASTRARLIVAELSSGPRVEDMDECEADEDCDDFSDLDKWLTRNQAEAAQDEVEVERPRWSVVSTGHVHGQFFSSEAKSFAEIGASERLIENLRSLGLQQPSAAQVEIFGPMLSGESMLQAHPSGTGKTWGYLAALVQQLWEWEQADGKTPPGQVRAIILVPNAELGQQVLQQARELANRSIRASIATGEGSKWSTQRDRLRSGLELLVVTMGRLVAHVAPRDAQPSFSLEGTRAVVVDEADMLYAGEAPSWYAEKHLEQGPVLDDDDDGDGDEGGGHPMDKQGRAMLQEPILANWKWLCSELPAGCITTLVMSQVPQGIDEMMRSDVPALSERRGKGLHMTRGGIDLTVVDCSTPAPDERGQKSMYGAKLKELRRALAGTVDERPPRRSVVICHSSATCNRLVRELVDGYSRERNVRDDVPWVHEFHASLRPERRKKALDAFKQPPPAGPSRVLITTGRAVRGLELGASASGSSSATPNWPVDSVILFDFPRNTRDYLARVGLARRGAQQPARVTALASGSQVAFAKAIQVLDAEGSEIEVLL